MQENNKNNFDNFDNDLTLGDKLRHLRQKRGYTQAMLGRKVGVRGTHISKWETDRSLPSRQYLIKLSKVLKVSLDSLENLIQEKPEEETTTLEEKIEEYGNRKEAEGISDTELDLLISFLRDQTKSVLRGLDYLEKLEKKRRNTD